MTDNINRFHQANDPAYAANRSDGAQAAVDSLSQAPGLEQSVMSKAVLDGSGIEAACKADAAASAAYQTDPGSQAFRDAFVAAPATGAATLMEMARIRSGFDPQNGKSNLADVNACMKEIGQIPYLSFTGSSPTKARANPDTASDLVDIIMNSLAFDNDETKARVAALVDEEVDRATPGGPTESMELLLYGFQMFCGDPVRLAMHAAKVTVGVTKTEKEHKHMLKADDPPEIIEAFDLDFNGLSWSFQMIMGSWTEEHLPPNHFSTIQEWGHNFDTPDPGSIGG